MQLQPPKGGFFVRKEYMTEKQFDDVTLNRLKFVKWLENHSGRPDRHGVQTPLPAFEAELVKEPESSRRNTSFIPENTTGV